MKKNNNPKEIKKKDNINKSKENKGKKLFLIIGVILILLLIATAIILLLSKKKPENKFALNSIYDAKPLEVRELYSNMVEVSCSGDLHLDVDLRNSRTSVGDLNKNNLLDYLFSHLAKKEMLKDEMDIDLIKNTEKDLFYGNIELEKSITNYHYNGYIYNVNGNKITRKKDKCQTSDIEYVSFLYGHSYNKNELSVDVNMAYSKNGILYDFNNKLLGSYDGDVTKLKKLMNNTTTHYRMNYIMENDKYKLSSVEWRKRGQ